MVIETNVVCRLSKGINLGIYSSVSNPNQSALGFKNKMKPYLEVDFWFMIQTKACTLMGLSYLMFMKCPCPIGLPLALDRQGIRRRV
jgi:hypothetical protein